MSEREKLVEVMARAFCASENVPPDEVVTHWDVTQHAWQTYTQGMTAALAALEAAGVRLAPVEASMEMLEAGHNERWAMSDAWSAMLAASPYAKDKPE